MDGVQDLIDDWVTISKPSEELDVVCEEFSDPLEPNSCSANSPPDDGVQDRSSADHEQVQLYDSDRQHMGGTSHISPLILSITICAIVLEIVFAVLTVYVTSCDVSASPDANSPIQLFPRSIIHSNFDKTTVASYDNKQTYQYVILKKSASSLIQLIGNSCTCLCRQVANKTTLRILYLYL